MVRFNQRKNSQRGAALVEAALTIVLIGVTAIPAIGVLGDRAADNFCDSAMKVKNTNQEVSSSRYHYDKESKSCCATSSNFSVGSGRGGGISGGGSECESTDSDTDSEGGSQPTKLLFYKCHANEYNHELVSSRAHQD